MKKEIRVRVSAIRDRSFDAVFRSIEENARRTQKVLQQQADNAAKLLADSAKRGARAVAQGSDEGAKALATNTKRGAKAAQIAYEDLLRSIDGKMPATMSKGTAAVVKFGNDTARSFAATKREFDQLAQTAERAMRGMSASQRTWTDSKGRMRDGMGRVVDDPSKRPSASDSIRRGMGMAQRAGQFAFRATRDLAYSAGADSTLSGGIRRAVDLEAEAIQLSNSGYMPGTTGPNGQRVNPEALERQALQVGNATGFGANDIIEGLQRFTAKTGDLETGRKTLQDMAVFAKATGASLEDMVDASADVSNGLGDVPNKADRIKEVMNVIAGQGKLGAVEIRNLASQMAKLSAASGQFEGDPGANMARFGALVQMTRAKGGAASATQAATSALSFTQTFSKSARRNAFKEAGIEIEHNGRLRNPMEIIYDSIKKTKGNTEAMGRLFYDAQARRMTRGWENIYHENGGGETGLAAVKREMDRLEKATMQNVEVQQSFAAAMSSTKTQAQLFDNAMTELGRSAKTVVTPALMMLGGAARTVADWVREASGFAERDRDRESSRVDLEGTNVYSETLSTLRNANEQVYDEKTGRWVRKNKNVDLADDYFARAAGSERSLDEQIAKTQSQLKVVKHQVRQDLGGDAANIGNNVPEDVTKMKMLESKLARLEDTRETIRAGSSQILDLLRDGRLTVTIKNPEAARPPVSPEGVDKPNAGARD